MTIGGFVTIECRFRQTERQDSRDKVEKHGFEEKKYVYVLKMGPK